MKSIVFWLCLLGSLCPSVAQTVMPVPRLVGQDGMIHRFFDTSPISPSGRYIALFKLPYEDKAPRAGDAGKVVVLRLSDLTPVAQVLTLGWEMQLGANVQWGSTDESLFYNDVDTVTWEAYAVEFNFKTGRKRRLGGTVFMVSPDGKRLASHNLYKSRFAQVGYGVVVPTAQRNVGVPEDDGIFITDVESSQCRLIASISDIYTLARPALHVATPEQYEFYCFQVKWNPQGTRLLATIQWTPRKGGERRRAVVTMNADGTDIRTAITPEQWACGGHHVNWMPDGKYLSMNLNIDDDPELELVCVRYDGSGLQQIYPSGSGHPSLHPGGLPWVITDAYAGEMPLPDGMTPLRLINLESQTEVIAARVPLPDIRNFELRIDAHPAWDRSGRYVVYNACKDGKRCAYLLDVSGWVQNGKTGKGQ